MCSKMINQDDVILRIYVATYNHEEYIGRALDSILMQKTKYKFEVLIGEDASTDGTRAVLKKYEEQFPGFFTIFYREKNIFVIIFLHISDSFWIEMNHIVCPPV